MNRILNAIGVFVFGAQGIYALQAEAQKDRVKVFLQVWKLRGFAGFYGDAADGQNEGNFPGGKVIDCLVSRNAVFVEAAGFLAGFKNRYIVAAHGKPVSAGQSCRTAAKHSNFFAGWFGAGIGVLLFGHQRIGGVALQHADFYGLAFRHFAYANFFAQGFSGTDPGAHAAQDILIENRLGCILRQTS